MASHLFQTKITKILYEGDSRLLHDKWRVVFTESLTLAYLDCCSRFFINQEFDV